MWEFARAIDIFRIIIYQDSKASRLYIDHTQRHAERYEIIIEWITMIDMLANVSEWMMETPPTEAPPRRYGRYRKKNECCDDNDRDSKFCWLRKINQKQPSGKWTKQQSHTRNWMQDTIHLGVVSSASCIWPVCVRVYVVCWDCCLLRWKKKNKKERKQKRYATPDIIPRSSCMLRFGSDSKNMKRESDRWSLLKIISQL